MAPLYNLDHIVILVPYSDVQNPPSWLIKNFTISPGGRHGDNLTENKLIAFKDGCYLELIAFIDDNPEFKKGHWWGMKADGVMDFALTTEGDGAKEYESLKKRIETDGGTFEKLGLSFGELKAGSRKRGDGQVVKWKVAFPPSGKRGDVPFFCHDVTDRGLRVPAEGTSHPCGAYGVKRLVATVPKEKLEDYVKAYEIVLGAKREKSTDGSAQFTIGSVHKINQASAPVLEVRGPSNDLEEKLVKGRGILLGGLVLGREGGGNDLQRLDTDEDMGGIFLE